MNYCIQTTSRADKIMPRWAPKLRLINSTSLGGKVVMCSARLNSPRKELQSVAIFSNPDLNCSLSTSWRQISSLYDAHKIPFGMNNKIVNGLWFCIYVTVTQIALSAKRRQVKWQFIVGDCAMCNVLDWNLWWWLTCELIYIHTTKDFIGTRKLIRIWFRMQLTKSGEAIWPDTIHLSSHCRACWR